MNEYTHSYTTLADGNSKRICTVWEIDKTKTEEVECKTHLLPWIYAGKCICRKKYVICVELGMQDMEVKDDKKHMWPDLAKPCDTLKEISMLHSKSEEVTSRRECVDTHIRHLTNNVTARVMTLRAATNTLPV